MKLPLPFTIRDLRFTIGKKSSAGAVVTRRDRPVLNRQSSIAHRKSASGVALVITLIMLSVTLIMAVAFLAVARRDRNAVSTATDTATAQLAADTALAAAQAQIAANIFSSTNLGAFNYSLLVSTNYINHLGYTSGSDNPTNVNYDYYINGAVGLSPADRNQNIANLLFLPRAPVVVGSNDFRYYLDLNRNGRDEANGPQPQFGPNGGYLHPDGTEDNLLVNVQTNFMTGDPEWIGVLEHPDQPHGPNNHFIARYAYFAQPIGNSLDLNYIHNEIGLRTVNAFPNQNGVNDSYARNQGVGTWELNLAAFLADLNTNKWLPVLPPDNNYYTYNWSELLTANSGIAFDDARALLSYRYNFAFNNLATAGQLFPNANNVFPFDNIDAYSDGPFQFTTTNIIESFQPDAFGLSWSGAENPNRFFSLPSDLFDPAKSSAFFTNRFWSLGTSNSTYDRYTFYRMLDQLGTDSSADEGKLNLNYDNTDGFGSVLAGTETNEVAWTPSGFFTNAAERLLRYHTAQWRAQNFDDYTNTFGSVTTTAFGLTNIPVYVEGRFVYSTAVNRLLQLAANIYDASTNSFYPSVFRPTFLVVRQNGFNNVYINGYQPIPSVANASDPVLGNVIDLSALVTFGPGKYSRNVYGVPWIIGAKKFMPNFNQFATRSDMQATRKLQVRRSNANQPGATGTNQMFIMSVTNHMGFSFWNSYDTNYPGKDLTLFLHDTLLMTMYLTNDIGQVYTRSEFTNFFINASSSTTPSLNPWKGSAWSSSLNAPQDKQAAPESFIYATCDFPLLAESQYYYQANAFGPTSDTSWETNNLHVYPFPQVGLATTNWLHAFIIDRDSGGVSHVIDYVVLDGPNGSQNMNSSTNGFNDYDPSKSGRIGPAGVQLSFWDTNVNSSGVVWDVVNQIRASRPQIPSYVKWKTPPNMPAGINTPKLESEYFDAFFTGASVRVNAGKKTQYDQPNTNLTEQVPYTPQRLVWNYTLWQANDPLVHYLASDLNTINRQTGLHHGDNGINNDIPTLTLNAVVDRYQPWGRGAQMSQLNSVDKNPYNFGYRDSLVWGSDYWDFPTNKYPSVGWLGRVHRGTPWQTISLKATNVLAMPLNLSGVSIGTNTWALWTGDTQTTFGRNFDAANAAPVHDSDLFDLFTARLNDNAVRGTLSVNQTHLAAWSAVFSGVVGLTNITENPSISTIPVVTNFIIQPAGPAGAGSPIGQIVASIKKTRDSMTGTPAGTFTHLGDILRTPALSEQSPFLNRSDVDHVNYDISDQLYEWLPQQTLGLLRSSSTPRYVVYCYGQTLRPAPDGTVTSSTLLPGGYNPFGLVTNYQVTAESAARAVIRVDGAATPTPKVTVESYNVLPPD